MGKKLSKAPVYYTVVQVQFNPILDIDSFVPVIQSKLREKGFPDFKQEVVQRLVLPLIGPDASASSAPALSRQSRYSFGNMEGQTNFLLDANGFTLQTSAYETFNVFAEQFLAGLSIVNSELKLAFVERIGLRYLDAVLPKEGENCLKAYLVPEVLGLSQHLGGKLTHSFSETLTETDAGQLISRVLIREGGIGLPEDLAIQPPQLAPRFTQWNGLHAIIDTDAFRMSREVFDLTQVKTHLTALHASVGQSFKATVTEHALKVWE